MGMARRRFFAVALAGIVAGIESLGVVCRSCGARWELFIEGVRCTDPRTLAAHIVEVHQLQAGEIAGAGFEELVRVHSALHERRYLAYRFSRSLRK